MTTMSALAAVGNGRTSSVEQIVQTLQPAATDAKKIDISQSGHGRYPVVHYQAHSLQHSDSGRMSPAQAFAKNQQVSTPAPVSAPEQPVSVEQEPSFDGMRDIALLMAIHKYTEPHKQFDYNEARRLMFGDVYNRNGVVTDVYTGRQLHTKDIPDGNNMNCEHTWPRSDRIEHTGAVTDLHQLCPADSKANNLRGNLPFGEVDKVQWEQNGAKLGYDKTGKMVFEPPEAHKGHVARIMFYVAATYNKTIPNDEEGVLKKWNDQDPVDPDERRCNELATKYQGKSNPFVDHPELADLVQDF